MLPFISAWLFYHTLNEELASRCIRATRDRGSSQRIPIRRDVSGVGVGDTGFGHRRLLVDRMRLLDPPLHVVRRIRQPSGKIDAARDVGERGADHAARLAYAG